MRRAPFPAIPCCFLVARLPRAHLVRSRARALPRMMCACRWTSLFGFLAMSFLLAVITLRFVQHADATGWSPPASASFAILHPPPRTNFDFLMLEGCFWSVLGVCLHDVGGGLGDMFGKLF